MINHITSSVPLLATVYLEKCQGIAFLVEHTTVMYYLQPVRMEIMINTRRDTYPPGIWAYREAVYWVCGPLGLDKNDTAVHNIIHSQRTGACSLICRYYVDVPERSFRA